MNDDSFLSHLEQRTQRVKITLANLEAERVRIEGLIARLQPLVPHYDALIAAERQIDEARIDLDQLSGERPREEDQSFAPEHLRNQPSAQEEPPVQGGSDWQPSGWHAARENESGSVWSG